MRFATVAVADPVPEEKFGDILQGAEKFDKDDHLAGCRRAEQLQEYLVFAACRDVPGHPGDVCDLLVELCGKLSALGETGQGMAHGPGRGAGLGEQVFVQQPVVAIDGVAKIYPARKPWAS